jgi:threonine aldolase
VQDQLTYTADQVARAARELREAAGASQQRFTAAQVVAMLADEVRLLRERGFSDDRIADLFIGFDIGATPDDISRV